MAVENANLQNTHLRWWNLSLPLTTMYNLIEKLSYGYGPREPAPDPRSSADTVECDTEPATGLDRPLE
eukprot:SAG31_NODE_12834_length_913_cov_1.796069_1_plen_67_part_01